MRKRLLAAAIGATALGIVACWVLTMPAPVPASALGPHTLDLANGRTMFFAGGCASCHASPGQDDRMRLGGGLALKSPFGTFFAPNISPHPRDGIGGWSEAQFVTALLKGTSPDGEHYFPSFPYPSYGRMRLEDARDLFGFMRTLPEVEGRIRSHDVAFPFSLRVLLGGWKFLFFDEAAFRPDPAQTAEWNRGAYLVNGPGHCAECHSPRNVLGGIERGRRFAGGASLEGEGRVPNITQARLEKWSEDDFVEVLTSGLLPQNDSVGSSMVEVVRNTSQLPEADRNAMAVYLKSLPRAE